MTEGISGTRETFGHKIGKGHVNNLFFVCHSRRLLSGIHAF